MFGLFSMFVSAKNLRWLSQDSKLAVAADYYYFFDLCYPFSRNQLKEMQKVKNFR